MITFRQHIAESVDLHLQSWSEAYLFSKKHTYRERAIHLLNDRLHSYQSVYKKSQTTSLYVLSYFLEESVIGSSHKKGIKGLEPFQRHLYTKCPSNQVILCTVASHTKPYIIVHSFVLEILTNNHIYIYQSVDSHYDLKECLEKYDIQPLNKEKLLNKLDKLLNNPFLSIRSKNFKKLFHASLFDVLKRHSELIKSPFTFFFDPFTYRRAAPQSIEIHNLSLIEEFRCLKEAFPASYIKTLKALILSFIIYMVVLKIRRSLL